MSRELFRVITAFGNCQYGLVDYHATPCHNAQAAFLAVGYHLDTVRKTGLALGRRDGYVLLQSAASCGAFMAIWDVDSRVAVAWGCAPEVFFHPEKFAFPQRCDGHGRFTGEPSRVGAATIFGVPQAFVLYAAQPSFDIQPREQLPEPSQPLIAQLLDPIESQEAFPLPPSPSVGAAAPCVLAYFHRIMWPEMRPLRCFQYGECSKDAVTEVPACHEDLLNRPIPEVPALVQQGAGELCVPLPSMVL